MIISTGFNNRIRLRGSLYTVGLVFVFDMSPGDNITRGEIRDTWNDKMGYSVDDVMEPKNGGKMESNMGQRSQMGGYRVHGV